MLQMRALLLVRYYQTSSSESDNAVKPWESFNAEFASESKTKSRTAMQGMGGCHMFNLFDTGKDIFWNLVAGGASF